MSKTFNLTYSQCKCLINNGFDLRDIVEQLNDQPEFLVNMGVIEDTNELAAILEGGCASGAYMPAVTYYIAKQCLMECEDSVLDEIAEFICEPIQFDPANESLGMFSVKLCSMAVESWCMRFSDMADTLDSNGFLWV